MSCINPECEGVMDDFVKDDTYILCSKCNYIQEEEENLSEHYESEFLNGNFSSTKFDQTEKQNENEKVCKVCGDMDNLIKRGGDIICENCGTVNETSIISREKDWNNYISARGAMDNQNERCAAPSNSLNPFMDKLSTFIPRAMYEKIQVRACLDCKKYYRHLSDKNCSNCESGSKNSELKLINRDISKLHLRYSCNHREKSFNDVSIIIESVSPKYPRSVINTAIVLWGEIMKSKKITRGGVRKGLIACCVYYAAIDKGCPRMPIEICKDFKMNDRKQFNKGDKEFFETFENTKWSHLLTKTSKSEDLLYRFCNELRLSFKIYKKCDELQSKYNLNDFGVVPKSAAAGIIYTICKQEKCKIKKSEISKKLGVCNPTLTNTYKIITTIIEKS